MRKHPGCSISESVVKRDMGLTADDVFLGIRAAGVLHGRTLLHSSEVLHNRIVLTHDRATMPQSAYQRMAAEEPMAGVFVLHDRLSVGTAIEEILLIGACSEQTEWIGRAVHLPL